MRRFYIGRRRREINEFFPFLSGPLNAQAEITGSRERFQPGPAARLKYPPPTPIKGCRMTMAAGRQKAPEGKSADASDKINFSAAISRIKDVDVAEECTPFAGYNILVLAGTAMLAQANQSPQAALRLLS
jgi:hypothetical protein